MKIHYKHIHFIKIKDLPKTSVYSCRNNRSDAELGIVQWYGPWRQYCYITNPNAQAVYSIGCLNDIANFIEQLSQ